MPKILKFDEAARRALERGATTLTRAVRVTLGPKGRNVVLEKKFGVPTVTNDGVTIARDITPLEDNFENMGAMMVREVAIKTNDIAGDGTTTATVLAHRLITEGMRNVAAGASPLALKRGIDKAVAAAVKSIQAQARDVEGKQETAQVASISAADPQIGALIADAMEQVGREGVVTVEESKKGAELDLEFTEGMQLDKGFLSAQFITDPDRQEAVLDDPYILIHQKKITSVNELLPLLEKVTQTGKPLLIIAEDVEGEALATLVVNKSRGTFTSVAVKAPVFGERRKAILTDLAVLTGGQLLSDDLGVKLENFTLDQLGRAKKVRVTKDDCTIIEGNGDPEAIKNRANLIRADLADASSDWEREKLSERLAKLAGGVAVIRVGAATEVELKEKRHRIEDAVSATKAALEEGIVPGGGTALVRARAAVSELALEGDEAVGAQIVHAALAEPLRWIVNNAGGEAQVIVRDAERESDGVGFNALTGEFEDLFKAGIIDPAKVTRSALQNAASVAGMLLTTETLVTDKPEPEPPIRIPNRGPATLAGAPGAAAGLRR